MLLQMPYSQVVEMYTLDKDPIEVYNRVKHYIAKNQAESMTHFCLSCCHPYTFVKEILRPFVDYELEED